MKAKLRGILLLGLVFVLQVAMAQERTVTGKVTSSEDGEVIPGVNVLLKGSGVGTTTDLEGNFKINLPSGGGVLVLSFIGFATQEVDVGSRSIINVALVPDVKQLSEVVVTAVGIERDKKALGYSVASLDGKDLAQRSEPDPVRSLSGKVAGVNIIGSNGTAGAGTRITIRGNSSLTGNNQPLFVVDGVPFDNSTFETGSFTDGSAYTNRGYDIDPNNIENITVLKGAAAAALYGSRAANGVIVITTKSGKRAKKGLEVTYNTSYAMEEVAGLPDYQKEYAQGNNFNYASGNVGTWGPRYSEFETVPHHFSGAAWENIFPQYQGVQVPFRAYDNAKEFFRTGSLLENSLNIASGGEKTNLVVGVSRSDNAGIVPHNKIDRTSFNIGGSATLDNGLFVSGSFNYVNVNQTAPPLGALGGGAPSVVERLLYIPPNVNLKEYPYKHPITGGNVYYRNDMDNPYWLAETSPYTSKVDRYFGNLTVGYDVLDWLNVSYKFGYNGYTDRRMDVIAKGSYIMPLGRIRTDDIYRQEIDGNLLITATKDLGKDFNLRALVGHNVNQRKTERQMFRGDEIIVFGINNMNNVATVVPAGGGLTLQRFHGVFGDISLSYRDYAFLNLVGRNDWSSTLPKGANSYFYPGVSGSFIFSEALRMESNLLSSGKIRAGLTKVGNEAGAYQTATVFETNPLIGNNLTNVDFPFTSRGVPFNGQTMGNTIGNPELRPEFTTEFEAGTDLQFLKGRVGLEFTYYKRTTTDQIVPISIAPSTGYLYKVTNIGKVSNQGIEAALNVTPVRTPGGFEWNIMSVFTRNRNIVEEIGGGIEEILIGGFFNLTQVVHQVGKPYGLIKGSVAARDEEGNLLVDPSTGKLIDGFDQQIIGNPNPDFLLGVTNTFSYKGLSLSILLDYRHGGDIYSLSTNQVLGRGLTTETVPEGGREKTFVIPGYLGDPTTGKPLRDDAGNKIPNTVQITSNDWWFINTFGSAGPDEFAVFDGTTIRLREVSLGYQLPKSLLEKTPFGTAMISLSGRNLWYNAPNFPKSMNFDPEVSSLGVGNAQGIDFVTVPSSRRYGINLRFTF